MAVNQSNIRWVLQIAATFRRSSIAPSSQRVRAFSTNENKNKNKPSICTADELHYVPLNNSHWRLAVWRYNPPPQAPPRNHPLLLLSGVGTNAIGYDLSPGSSFARYMCEQGFDTWILEVRGTGLSMRESDSKEIDEPAHEISEQMEAATKTAMDDFFSAAHNSNSVENASAESEFAVAKQDPTGIATIWDESRLVAKLTETFMRMTERLSGFMREGQLKNISTKLLDQISRLLEDSFISEHFNEMRGKLSRSLKARQNSTVASQIRDLSEKLVNIIDEGQRSISPPLFDLQERLTTTVDDFQKQLELIIKYDWDFDHYLEEDVPAAIEYVRAQTKPKDGKLLAIGHSMGGILLYAMLSRCGNESGLAAVVTLASSLDYTSSKSSLKLLLPLADPAQVLNVPVVPLGALLTAAYPLSSRSPYVLAWLTHMISVEGMMATELLKKLVMNSFCNIPAKLLLQLKTAFQETGLCDRSGTFFYKDHLHKTNVPVLALAGDHDLICPPEAVYETAKLIPEDLVTYRVFGEPEGPHYAHYDLVGARLAVDQVYPCIIQFLSCHDSS